MNSSTIHYLWRGQAPVDKYRTAFSLHGHTMLSREKMMFLPKVLRKVPWLHAVLQSVERRYRETAGKDLDYSRVWWTPPLSPRSALRLESLQIEELLGLRPLVSLSDHDSIEACSMLQLFGEREVVPMSLEWTVPYHEAVFHLGIHNLPKGKAHSIVRQLRAYTKNPKPEALADILAELHAMPDVLTVFNHPFSDEGYAGAKVHEGRMLSFLERHAEWIHALELNALQPWNDNARVAVLAREKEFPLISGGDRHGCEPNGNLNLTNAESFDEFVNEIRCGGVSNVLFLPQCREPLAVRYLENLWHVLREYPDAPGRVRWKDRIYYRCDDGEVRSLGAIATGTYVKGFSSVIGLFGFLAGPLARPALRLAFPPAEETAL